MIRSSAITVIFFAVIQTALGQTKIQDNLSGEWTGLGKLFGGDASFTMKWEPALNGKFLRLVFQNNYTANGKNYVMDAEAFYKQVSDTSFTGTWFDSRGMVLPLRSVIRNNTFITEWGSAETERGKTEYELTDKNNLEARDFIWRNGQWQFFGQASYKRKV